MRRISKGSSRLSRSSESGGRPCHAGDAEMKGIARWYLSMEFFIRSVFNKEESMKKKYVMIALAFILAVGALIFGRYHYRIILSYLIPDTKLEADEIKLPVLIYHHFSEEKKNDSPLVVGRENFKRQMKCLKDNGYHTISFRELVDFVEKGAALPEKPVLITIDDGYESNYTIAYEVLKEYDLKATIFMIGHALGAKSYKNTGAIVPPYITLEQAKEMIASGLISIQSHSMDMHQVAAYEEYLNNQKIRTSAVMKDFDTEAEYIQYFHQDTQQSRKQITQDFGEEWLAYSYPLGQHDDLTERLLTEDDIKVTLIVERGMNIIKKGSPESLRKLKRFSISDKTSNWELERILQYPASRKK